MLSDAQKLRLSGVTETVALTAAEFTETALVRAEHLAAMLAPGRSAPNASGTRLELGLLVAILTLAEHGDYLGERIDAVERADVATPQISHDTSNHEG